MPARKRAAIDADEIDRRPLSELTADQFLDALNSRGISLGQLHVWPEKKKYELWVDEGSSKATFGGLVRVIREKKKVELEKDPRIEGLIGVKRAGLEGVTDLHIQDDFVEKVATLVEARLRGRTG